MENKGNMSDNDLLRYLVAILAWGSFFGVAWLILLGWNTESRVWFFLMVFWIIGVATSWRPTPVPPTGGEKETKHEVRKG